MLLDSSFVRTQTSYNTAYAVTACSVPLRARGGLSMTALFHHVQGGREGLLRLLDVLG